MGIVIHDFVTLDKNNCEISVKPDHRTLVVFSVRNWDVTYWKSHIITQKDDI